MYIYIYIYIYMCVYVYTSEGTYNMAMCVYDNMDVITRHSPDRNNFKQTCI